MMLHATNFWHCALMVLHHHVAQRTRPKMVHVGVMAAVILDSVFCSSVLLPTIDVRDPTLKIKQRGHSKTKSFLKFDFSLFCWRKSGPLGQNMCYEGWYLEINTHCVLHHAWVNLVSQVKWKKMFLFHLVNLRFLLLKNNNQPTNQPPPHPTPHTHMQDIPPTPTTTNQAPNKQTKTKQQPNLDVLKHFLLHWNILLTF